MSENWKEFASGSFAASLAVIFSNPVDVVKTRLQLQGELGMKGASNFRNPIQALIAIARTEGLRGVQRGLTASIPHQMVMNGLRIGSYSVLTKHSAFFSPTDSYAIYVSKRLLAGFSCGFGANFVASPLYLLKIRFQSYSPYQQTAVGTQHRYRSVAQAFRQIFREGAALRPRRPLLGGARALYQGAVAGSMRVGAAGSVQLTTYDSSKRFLSSLNFGSLPELRDSLRCSQQRGAGAAQGGEGYFFQHHPLRLHISAGLMSGVAVQVFTCPLDVVSTRLYNQSRGVAAEKYNGVVDAFQKIFKYEGVRGFYKGALSGWVRVGPHTLFTFLFLEQFKVFFDI